MLAPPGRTLLPPGFVSFRTGHGARRRPHANADELLLSANAHPAGYLGVALPEGPPAGEERIVPGWLHVAVNVDRPRPDLVLAREWASPS